MSIRRVYETTFIVNAAIEDSDIEAVISKVSGYIENNGGQIHEVNRWGRRRLAYPINKKYNGFYVHFVFESKPALLPILERFLVLEDTVLRHLTLILPKKLSDYRIKVAIETGRTYDSAFVDADKDKADRADRADKAEKADRAERTQKAERAERAERAQKEEAPEITEAAPVEVIEPTIEVIEPTIEVIEPTIEVIEPTVEEVKE
jgi:small subunit ribosomal protein S6